MSGANEIVAESEAFASSSLHIDLVIGSVLFWTIAIGRFSVFATSSASEPPWGKFQKSGARKAIGRNTTGGSP